MCIHLSISNGKRFGFVSGLGAATADMLFGGVAIFGVSVLSNFFLKNDVLIRTVGGLMIVLIGVKMIFDSGGIDTLKAGRDSMIQSYFTTFLLTLTNPMTIIAYMTVLALFNVMTAESGPATSTILLAGIFLGSTIWFFLLTGLAVFIKQKLSDRSLVRLNKLLGVVLLVFGVYLLAQKALSAHTF